MGTGTRAQLLFASLSELPWFGPSGASFIPATHPDRRRVEWRSRMAGTPAVRLARCVQAVLEGREHAGMLEWHGAKQACQHRPSNDEADATSMCVIVLNLARHQLRQLRSVIKPVNIDVSEVGEFYAQIKGRLGDIVQKDLHEVIEFKLKIDEFQNNLIQEQRAKLINVIRIANENLAVLEQKYRRLLEVVDLGGNLKGLKQIYAAYKEKSDQLAQLRAFVERYEQIEKDKQHAKIDKETRLLTLQSMIGEESERIKNFELFVLDMHEFIQGNRRASFDIMVTPNKQIIEFVMRIDDDGSHSLEREKVFIYDVSLLLSAATRDRHPGFLLHDNIFGVDDDTLRRSLQFLYHQGEFAKNQQYIITFNEDQLEHVSADGELADDLNEDVRARYTKANRFLKSQYQEIT